MRSYIAVFFACIGACAALITPVTAQDAGSYTFAVTPASISGPAGSTIGWGYTLTNDSTQYWLLGFDVQSSSPFLHGTATTNPFNYPLLAPGGSLTVTYDGIVGLADLTWDSNAPAGFTNSGEFTLTSYFYDGDPSVGGNPVGGAVTRSSTYLATVSAPATVPEVSSVVSCGLLLCLGMGGMAVSAYRRKARSQ